MQASTSLDYWQCMIFSDSTIKKLWTLLDERIGQVSASASCSDKTTRTFTKAKDLIDYENSASKRIQSVDIKARSSIDKRASINIGSSFFASVSVSIEADEQVVSRLRADIDEILEGAKAWYAYASWIRLDALVWIVGTLSSAVVLVAGVSRSDSPASFGRAFGFAAIGVSMGVGLIVTALWLEKIKGRMFPAVTFAIGQGAERHRTFENLRWVVIVGGTLSVVTSIAIALFFGG